MSRRRAESKWEERPERVARGGFGLGKLSLLVLVGVAVAGWFAPAIVLQTGLRDSLLRYALGDFPGRVGVGTASAGWLSPIVVQQVTVMGEDGQEVVTAEAIKSEKTLLALLSDTAELGVIRVEQPHLRLVLREDGSNLEDLVRPLLSRESPSRPVACLLDVVEGKLTVQSHAPAAGRVAGWTADHLNIKLEMPGAARAALEARGKGDFGVDGHPAGKLTFEAVVPVSGSAVRSEPATAGGTLSLSTESLPLAVLDPLFQRWRINAQLQGGLTSDISAAWNGPSPAIAIKQAVCRNLVVSAAEWLGPEPIRLPEISAAGTIELAAGEWKLNGGMLKSEMLQLEAAGTLPAGNGSLTAGQLAGALQQATGELRGRVDVARLAAALPQVLRIREGTHIASGDVALDLRSQPEAQGHRWNGRLEAKGIAAVHQGQSLAWRQPILAEVNVRQVMGSWAIDRLACESSFLKLTGNGTLEKGELTAQGDLTRLLADIGQFVNLGATRAAGSLQTTVNWQREADQRIAVRGEASAENLEIASASIKAWREPRLDVTFAARARTNGSRLAGLDEAAVDVKAAGEHLAVQLREPTAELSSAANWPLRYKVQGDLGQWLTRVQMFYPLTGWQIDGEQFEARGDANVAVPRVELVGTKAQIRNLQVFGPGIFVREPELQIETDAAWDAASGSLTANRTTVVGTTVALRADNVRLARQGPSGFALDGDVQYRTDLARLSSWFVDPRHPAPFRLTGGATGSATFAFQNSTTQANLTAQVEDFSYAQPARPGGAAHPVGTASAWQELWQEPRLQLAAQGSYDAHADQVAIQKIEAAGETLSLGAAGHVRQPFTVADADLNGQYAYDLERLAQRIRGLLGPNVQMTGKGTKPFRLRGPLLAAFQTATPNGQPAEATRGSSPSGIDQLLAEAGIAWESLVFQGVQVGPAEVETRLEKGKLTVAPLELPVSEGVVRLTPTLDLNQTPSAVTLAPGTLADQIRISPEMCRTWLKYVAPLVADATAAEGKFSVQIENASFPSSDLTGGNVQGRFIVHSARVGPGPLATEMLQLVSQVKSLLDRRPSTAASPPPSTSDWLEIPQQQLNLQLTDHRVYHRDLQMAIKDIVVRTQGWVGIDQQLGLIAEVPVRDEWVAQDRWLASLRGQSIKLPVYGSLSRPQIDRRALTELSRQAIRDAGTNFLQDQLNRGLERLLPTRPPAQP